MEIIRLKKNTKIGSCYSRTVTISNSGKSIELIFIRHASQYFSWQKWNTYLHSKIGTQINYLTSNMKL